MEEDLVAKPRSGRLFARVRKRLNDEQVEVLAGRGAVRIERIVSTGHASPPGFWYDQERPEFVVVLAGAAATAKGRIMRAGLRRNRGRSKARAGLGGAAGARHPL